MSIVADGSADEIRERARVQFPAGGDVSVPADFPFQVELGFTVLSVGSGHQTRTKRLGKKGGGESTRDNQIDRGLMWRFMR